MGYRDSIPPWAQTLKSVSHDEYMVGENRIVFYKVHATNRSCYPDKPFIALELLEKFPEIERLFYADPDVTFVAPWQFFDQWVDLGLALVEDSNFPEYLQTILGGRFGRICWIGPG